MSGGGGLPPITGSGAGELPVPTGRGEATVGPPVPVETKPFDPEPRRENMRAVLAALFVGVFLSWASSSP